VNINKGEAFYGEVDILGKPYVTGYDPIKDASGKVIGIWYADSGGSRPRIRDDVAHHSDLMSPGIPR
jgi:Single cache domain 3